MAFPYAARVFGLPADLDSPGLMMTDAVTSLCNSFSFIGIVESREQPWRGVVWGGLAGVLSSLHNNERRCLLCHCCCCFPDLIRMTYCTRCSVSVLLNRVSVEIEWRG